MTMLIQIRQALEGINPNVPWLALALASWLVCYALRKLAPTVWVMFAEWGPQGSTISHVSQALPSVIASAVIAALGTGGDPWLAAKGALFGAAAPLWHHLLKRLPVPYQGARGAPVDGPTSRRMLADVLNEIVDAPDVAAAPTVVRITLNGRERHVSTPISYDELVELAGQVGYPSMTLKSGNSGRIVAPGNVVHLRDGDVINAIHTGSA